MVRRALALIDAVSGAAAVVSMFLICAMIVAMLVEVVARYVLGAPTNWAFDISYMLNGALFFLAIGYALQRDQHVRIDFFSGSLPSRVQDAICLIFYVVLFFPLITILTGSAVMRAWSAFLTDKVDPASPWAPLVWPFYAAIAMGLIVFALQIFGQIVRHALGVWWGQASGGADRPDTTTSSRF